MILAVDVDYEGDKACVAGVQFRQWTDELAVNLYTSRVDDVAYYVSGQFYRRELPCIMQLFNDHSIDVKTVVVDGFVYLDGDSKPGLGKYLYDAFDGRINVIGVAKNSFNNIGPKYQILRGQSEKPLYITSVGIELEEAKAVIISMAGPHRFPDLLKQVDKLCRSN